MINNSNILIYQNDNGNIKVDVRFKEEELDNKVVVRNNRTTTTDGKINELFGITEQFKFII